jgi:hypothetical protein
MNRFWNPYSSQFSLSHQKNLSYEKRLLPEFHDLLPDSIAVNTLCAIQDREER